MQVSAASFSQNKKFSLNMKGVTLEKVFDEIENQSEFVLYYSKSIVDDDVKVSVKVNDASVDAVLKEVLNKTNLNYEIVDNTILISKSKAAPKQQDGKRIKGTVTDAEKEPLPGATVTIVGTTKGVITDMDGRFDIAAKPGDKLVISFIGMDSKIIDVTPQTNNIKVELSNKAEQLEDVTVVAFGKQKKESVIASVTTVKPGELKVPTSNLTTAIAGRVSGVISYQRSGEPGQDNAEFFVRGVTTFGYSKSPLILLDGFEISASDLAKVQPDDVASFSIMKDATATALYGARGANGVILVTTKEGREGKAKVSFRHETSMSRATQIPEVVDGVEYMKLYNQAQFNDNPLLAPYYSAQRIENTKLKLNEYAFPNVNWYDQLFKDYTINKRYNLNVSGGGKIVNYYLAATYNKDNGILRVDKRNDFNNNIEIDKYNIRANLNIKLGKTTKVSAKFNSDFKRQNSPIPSGTSVFNSVMNVNPVEFPMFYAPDEKNKFTKHILFGNVGNVDMTNPYAEMVKGYRDSFSSTILSQLALEQELGFITEGLSLRAAATIQSYGDFSQERSYEPYYYTVNTYDDITNSYDLQRIKEGTESLGSPNEAKNANSRNYFEVRLMYNRKFGVHDVSGLLVGMAEEKMNQGSGGGNYATLPSRNNGLSGRLTYGYDSRYMAEVNFGYNGSEKFADSERYGFFPSFGLGYMISNEHFWTEGMKRYISSLKFKMTYGLVGNDAVAGPKERFFFLSDIEMGKNGYIWGQNLNNGYAGYNVKRYANPLITWEKAKKLNAGFEMEIAKIANFQVDIFHEKRTDIYMQRNFIPYSVGMSSNIYGNVGEAESKGIDASLDLNVSINKDFWISGRSNFTYATNKILQNEEQFKYDYQNRIGHPVHQQWGLVAERLFVDQNEIDNSPRQTFGVYKPGDIKYKDVDGDGVVDDNDKVPIGHPTTPEITYGFGLSTGYKGIDFSFFFQGSARSSFFINAGQIAPFVNRKNALKIVIDDYWSQNNPDPKAFWPRLSASKVDNNTQQSTWWMRDGTFLRLKNVEMGYTLPKRWIKSMKLSHCRIYASGSNLLKFSKFDLWDPEMAGNGLGYPLQRVFNAGVQISF
ncbi:SusC/RagA family TonB-linked outer membrane protein [Puteibacter caeruleilacunae]|nr:SusC/RagA family TonB-linked outer membrane protein [Puteibacter caeruleilacunae]